jgi:hypothetical protein
VYRAHAVFLGKRRGDVSERTVSVRLQGMQWRRHLRWLPTVTVLGRRQSRNLTSLTRVELDQTVMMGASTFRDFVGVPLAALTRLRS